MNEFDMFPNPPGARLFKLGLILFIILLILSFSISLFPVKLIKQVRDGQHTGIVTAVETNGIIFMRDSVYFKTDGESTQEDIYCVIDENIKNKLIEYQKNKTVVTLFYDDYFIIGIPLCKYSPIIIGVEEELKWVY